jgi:hypothetical protein
MTIKWADAPVNAAAALLNTGTMKIYTGSQPARNSAPAGTLLATLTFGATAFGSSSGGSATANAITAGTAVATGTAGCFALYKSDGTTLVGTGTCGTSGTDAILNTTSIVTGANVSCSSFTLPGGAP